MRRGQSEIREPLEIERILSSTNIGRMASLGEDGYPYITPVNFVFFRECVYFHCAPEGEKLDNIRRNPKVCFEVDIPLAYLDAGFDSSRPTCHLHQFYHCVVIRGTASVVEDPLLKVDALNALVRKHEPGVPFEPVNRGTPQVKACEVVEVRPVTLTAKSDLAQGKDAEIRERIEGYLAGRGKPGDGETVKAMRASR